MNIAQSDHAAQLISDALAIINPDDCTVVTVNYAGHQVVAEVQSDDVGHYRVVVTCRAERIKP